MKQLFILLPLWTLFLFTSCRSEAQSTSTTARVGTTDRLEVLYFHSEHRCKTCNQIELMTRRVLEQHYSAQLKTGRIVFAVYNADDPKNEAIVQKFLAFGSSLYLNKRSQGKESKMDLTEFAFVNAFNEELFTTKLRSFINSQLN